MKICTGKKKDGDYHQVIVHGGKICPLCNALKQIDYITKNWVPKLFAETETNKKYLLGGNDE